MSPEARQANMQEVEVVMVFVPTFGHDGFAVALCRDSPFPKATASDGKLYTMLVAAARDAKRWIDANGEGSDDPLFPSEQAFLALTLLAGPMRHVPPEEALLAIIAIGSQAMAGHSLEQAWAKAARHWETSKPNGEAVFLGTEQMYEGDCNSGLSDEVDGLVFGAEGLSQFPARHAGRTIASSLSTRLKVALHGWNNDFAGRNLSEGRGPWVMAGGYYRGEHGFIRRGVSFVLGELS
jgi:hypothetical protein